MKGSSDLEALLKRIDGRGYPAYKDIRGSYDFGDFILSVDHVQGDPFASPSRLRIIVMESDAGFGSDCRSSISRDTAFRDYLARIFAAACRKYSRGGRGSGKSGFIGIAVPGQEILSRSSVIVRDGAIEVRFTAGLPAFGRRVAGRHAVEMLLVELPDIARNSLFSAALEMDQLYRHIITAEDADAAREMLPDLGLVAFVADGSILPRMSGIDPRPLDPNDAIPFLSPDSMQVILDLPNRGSIKGMGIPEGVTLITGGGYHGKSTLLNALELGVYNHIPADGREFVVTVGSGVKIRAEDGRRVEKADISAFISNLPFGTDTSSFSTEDASGSTSQAANCIEAIEIGAWLLLIDEDTSATNFMVRDMRMQQLVEKTNEPITPFIDRVRQLYDELGISTIMVVGGCGDYLDVCDTVICMIDYSPHDYTSRAAMVADKYPSGRMEEVSGSLGDARSRYPIPSGIDPAKGKREVKVSAKGLQSLQFGRYMIDLSCVEQLVDTCQTRAIGDAIVYARQYMDGKNTMKDLVGIVMDDMDDTGGFDLISRGPRGDYAAFRSFEFAAAINRLRSLKIKN